MSGTGRQGLTERTSAGMAAILAGRRAGLRGSLLFAGPAVIASIAYMDPGNFATNIQAGSAYGYALLWVVLVANALAMLFQALSARLGIVTGRNLAELSRDHFPRPVVLGMWGISEVAAMATDLAEFLGGAIGLAILFRLPLLAGMGVTAAATYALLTLDRRGFRPMEIAIGLLVGVIGVCYVIELAIAPVRWGLLAHGTVVPALPDGGALTIAVAIVGATVMPHAIYLHSGLTQDRAPRGGDAARRRVIGFSNREVVVALVFAGLVNMAMVAMAAAAFHAGHKDVADIQTAWHTLTPLLGVGAASVFLVSLMASGISSSAVGTIAGQMIMQGFVRRRIPVLVRRLVTMIPAFVVVACGIDPTRALVLSQIVLSFALPVPMIALVLLTRRRDVMGAFASGPGAQAVAIAATGLVCVLNLVLLLQTVGVPIPFLGAG